MGLSFYSTLPKSLRSIYLKGFLKNPMALLGLTKIHAIIHSAKILKKYNLVELLTPVLGISILLSALPLYVVAIIFILPTGYMAFIISRKFNSIFKRGEIQNA